MPCYKNRTLAVIIGRSNVKRNSRCIDEIIWEISNHVEAIMFYRNPYTEIKSSITPKINAFSKAILTDHFFRPFWRAYLKIKIFRRILQFAYLSLNLKMSILLISYVLTRSNDYKNVRKILKEQEYGRVILISHSAGGILSTKLESFEKIVGCICFGYPFKHPQKEHEPYRTKQLSKVEKPFYIFQGDNDEYGSASKAKEYSISSSTRIISVDTDHDFSNLKAVDRKKILDISLSLVE